MAIFAQVTAGSGWPSALQLRLTVVPALTLIVPGPLVSMILADSKCNKCLKSVLKSITNSEIVETK